MAFRDFLKVQKQGLEGLASVGTIGLHMVSGPLVGLAIGYFLDKWLETSPWCKLIFLFLGIGAGFFNVYLDSKLLIARMDRKKQTADTETSAETGPGAAAQAAANVAQPGTGQAASADDTAAHGEPETMSDDASALTLRASLGTPESGHPDQPPGTAQGTASGSQESERKS